MWLVNKYRILTQNLQKKGWSRDLTCQLCDCDKSYNHLLFKCFYAQ